MLFLNKSKPGPGVVLSGIGGGAPLIDDPREYDPVGGIAGAFSSLGLVRFDETDEREIGCFDIGGRQTF